MPKKGRSKSTAISAPLEEDFPELDVRPERWVSLQVKLVTWDHLNFSALLRTSARLYTVVDKVRERHGGSILDVILYRHQVHPQNILIDLGCTLDEAGYEGGPLGNPKEEVMWYDYQVVAELEAEAKMKASSHTHAATTRRSSVANILPDDAASASLAAASTAAATVAAMGSAASEEDEVAEL